MPKTTPPGLFCGHNERAWLVGGRLEPAKGESSLTISARNYGERNLEELETFVTARPGEDLIIPFGIEDVGGDLVSIASAGLYSDPRDTLREFCQNGVDAGANRITIRFTGLNAAVIDDGRGMGFEELIYARRFGRSSKSAADNVGYRGIGIYSGFQICERLIVVSQQAGSDRRWTMTFDFASMRRTLAERVDNGKGLETALGPLIQENTTVAFDRLAITEVPRSGSTISLLENIDPDAYKELSELGSLRNYLRRTLPVPFSDSFEHKSKVERYLERSVPGYKTIAVRLTNDDTGFDEDITRSFPDNLQEPRFLEAAWPPESASTRAVIWACMSKRATLKPNSGIYFKKRGFTLGDGTELREKFSKRPAVYDWYVGEVYVVDETVMPNAARNGFEKNTGYRNLWSALDAPTNTLLREADDFSKRNRATEVVGEVEAQFRELIGTVNEKSAYAQAVSALEAIQRMYVKLEAQKIPVKDPTYNRLRKTKGFLVNLIDQERARLRELIENAEPPAAERSDEVRLYAGAENPLEQAEHLNGTSPSALLDLFAVSGWRIDEPLRSALLKVEAAMAQALGNEDTSARRAVIDALRSLLRVER
jgi:hypothetical protein